MINKTILLISNDNNFFYFCQASFRGELDFVYASHDQIDVYYTRIPHFAGILLSEENASPKQLEKTSKRLKEAPKNSIFICKKNLDDPEQPLADNVILANENFRTNVLLKLGIGSATSKNGLTLVGNTHFLEKRNDKSTKNFKEQLDTACKCDSLVLLIGETGSGKNFAARYIHQHSSRKEKSFTEESLACIDSGFMASTLFGTTHGSFTDAENKVGLLEDAKDGTLFLDEIGELSLKSQGKFLRFLDDRMFKKLGSQKTIKCDARLIFSTNANLQEKMKTGQFKKELFYRISVFVIKIPPLRERKEEIESLATQFAVAFGKKLSFEAVKKLESYSWPGNIRELKHCIEQSSRQTQSNILSDSDIIFLDDCF